MSRPYEVLEHTADIGLRARGETLEETFANMALGMIALIVPEEGCVLATEERRVEARAASLEGLLVAWLSEFVYLIDAERFLPAEIEPPRVVGEFPSGCGERAPWTISASVRGELVDPARHRMEVEIKGVSYHLLEIEKVQEAGEAKGKCRLKPGGGWVAQAIFDV